MKKNNLFRLFVEKEHGFVYSLLLILLLISTVILAYSPLPDKKNKNPDEIYFEWQEARLIPENILFQLEIKEYDVPRYENDIYELIKIPTPVIEEKEEEEVPEEDVPVETLTNLSQLEQTDNNFEPEYLDILYTKIARNKYYPEICVERNQQGTVSVTFTIQSDGSVTDLEIYEESPYKYLNLAAIKTVEDSVPFPPLEGREEWAIIIDIVFEIY